VHKAMLAAAFSRTDQTLLAFNGLKPTRFLVKDTAWPAQERCFWLWRYWEQISDEIWAYYAGEYRDFLEFKAAGWALLDGWSKDDDLEPAHRRYTAAAATYIAAPRWRSGAMPGSGVANGYDQMLARSEAIVAIRDYLRAKSGDKTNAAIVLATAILAQMKKLLPGAPFKPGEELFAGLMSEIVRRIDCPGDVEAAVMRTVTQLRAKEADDA